MPILSMTPGGANLECDICHVKWNDYSWVECGICQAVHCNKCGKEADERGDYSADADFIDGQYVDNSYWKECLDCKEAA